MIGCKLLFTVLFITTTAASKPIPNYAGPYRIIVRQFANLTQEDAGTQQLWMRLTYNHTVPIHNTYTGPYTIIVRQFPNLSKEDAGTRQFWMWAYVQSYRRGHPQYLYGRAVNTIPLSDEYQLTTYIDIRSNNQWKKNAFVLKFPHFCSDSTKYALSEKTLVFGEDAKICPTPVGERVIKNQSINLYYPEIPIFPYGRWLVTNIKRDKKGKSLGGSAIDMETVPKV